MKRLFLILLAFLTVMVSQPAQARTHVSLSFGYGYHGCCAYRPWPYYDPYWTPAPIVYTPAPVVYAPPPPPVVYVEPARTVYVEPASQPLYVQETGLSASQTSDTYTDDRGRTCRQFQSFIGGNMVYGKACLMSDGTWRTVE